MNHDVFISYSKKDAARIKPLRRALDAAGIKYWIDDRIDGSANFLAEIPEAISHCSIVLFVASEDSARSAWTQKELLYAQKHKKDIFPYKLDNNFKFENCAELDFFFTNIQWKESVDDVVAGLSKKLGISKTPHKVTQNIIKDSSEKFSHKSAEPTQIMEPSIKPTLDKIKRYWWVALCVALCVLISSAVWYSSTGKGRREWSNPDLQYINSDLQKNVNDIKTQENQTINIYTQKQTETKTSTSTPKEEQKSVQTATVQKAETSEIKKDNSYLLNLPDNEFVRYEGNNGKYGYKLKSTGEIVISSKYDGASHFREGLVGVELNAKCGFVDKTGKEVIPLKYDDASSFSGGLAAVKLNGKYGYIDKTGKEITSLKYDVADMFYEGLGHVKLNGKYGFVNRSGKEVIPLKYDIAWYFSEGLAPVELKDKWGFIDKTGKVVIPLKYDGTEGFSGGKAKVKLNGEEFYIDKNGNRTPSNKNEDLSL